MAAIDWSAVHAEALDIFVNYLRIPSVNPPGNEAPAARYLGSLIEAEGIAVEYIETSPGREIVVARITGDGSKRPLMLCNHLDVVPVEERFWTVPAFEGVIKDGKVYGRGAVDMKSGGVMQLMAFLLLARQRTPLARDIVFCGVPDEEAGGAMGMKWLCEHRPDLTDVEFELNEGGMGASQFLGKDAHLFTVATGEKNVCWLNLSCTGTPGHGSRPHKDNSLVHLARALIRLAEWERAPVLIPQTREYISRMKAAGLLPEDAEQRLPEVIEQSAALKAMFINTLNPTMFHSGIKANVIPARSEATIDCRILPGQDHEEWRQQVIARIDDPRIEVTFNEATDLDDPGASPFDTELFHLINDVVKGAMEDAVVTPTMTVGGTDNRYLRAKGIPAYGFIPALLSPEEASGFHGNDEHITIDNLNLGVEIMYEVVRRFCAR